jgi:hypothetical protein
MPSIAPSEPESRAIEPQAYGIAGGPSTALTDIDH